MIAFLGIVLISVSAPRAQSNVEYSFHQQAVADGQSYGETGGSTGDPVPVLSMDCLAANGYGQWTMSSQPGQSLDGTTGASDYPPGWYLLGNSLRIPSIEMDPSNHNPAVYTSHPGCIPPGTVQNGSFTGNLPTGQLTSPETLVTANLDGTVCYVWPDPMTRQNFVINQFTSTDVDLSLSFLLNPQSVSTPGSGTMNIIQTTIPIHNFLYSSSSGCGCSGSSCTHDIIPTSTSPYIPYQDIYSIAIDAQFLYIVWTTTTNTCLSGTGSEIWATVIDLTTNSTYSGWPQVLGKGIRPTVACDPRNNRSGTTAPAFEVAWITLDAAPVIGRISCVGGSLGTMFTLSPYYIHPLTGSTTNYFNKALHAKVLVSSAPGSTPAATTAVYAIVDMDGTGTNDALLYYLNAVSTTNPSYVDGGLITTHPSPISDPGTVKDNFISACANPYDYSDRHDGGSTYSDQFHCLYQFITTAGTPLLIVEGADNGAAYPGGTTDVRLVLNQSGGSLLSDPVSYVIAVNQMGIHVHWRNGAAPSGTHYYSRDCGVTTATDHHISRAFDENIEEPTLVTGQCYVADGTSHGGTVGATVITHSAEGSNARITVWSDPNYGPPNATGTVGMYSPLNLTSLNSEAGTLNFTGSNVKLTIGDNVGYGTDVSYYTYATLAVMPLFYFNFSDKTQSVLIKGNSTFDYYGLNELQDGSGSMATPFTDGSADGLGEGTIDLEGIFLGLYGWNLATLNVHGGADFFTGKSTTLTSSAGGAINVLHEASIFPPNAGHANAQATGHMTLWGVACSDCSPATHGGNTLTGSDINGNAPGISGTDPGIDVIITGLGDFTADACAVQNNNVVTSSNPGLSTIQFGDANDNFATVTVTNSTLDAAQLHVENPSCWSQIYFESNYFDDLRNFGIEIEAATGDPAEVARPSTTVSGNTFLHFAQNAANSPTFQDLGVTSLFGIWLRNFAHYPKSDANCTNASCTCGKTEEGRGPVFPWFYINVADNIFTTSGNYNDALVANDGGPDGLDEDFESDPTSAAILLENTTANVTGNDIEDNGYSVGIASHASPIDGFDVPQIRSLICSNTINSLFTGNAGTHEEIGVWTDFFDGYIQNNTITNCDNGYAATGTGSSSQSSKAHFICNTLNGNKHKTVEVNDHAIIDMSGLHSLDASTNYAAFNTIEGPSTWVGTDNANNEFSLIQIENDGVENTASIIFSNSLLSTGTTWNVGENNIILSPANASGNQPLLESDGGGLPDILSLDNNFFEVGTTPVDPSMSIACSAAPACTTPCFSSPLPTGLDWSPSTVLNVYGLGYCATPAAFQTSRFGSAPSSWGVPDEGTGPSGCQDWVAIIDGLDRTKKNPIKPLSTDTSLDTICENLYDAGIALTNFGQWQESYDTIMRAIDLCPNLTSDAVMAFSDMSEDIESLLEYENFPYDSMINANFRIWLYSKLYLNLNPDYFCACVAAIFATFPYTSNDSTDQLVFLAGNRKVAFDQWIVQNTSCDTSDFLLNWKQVRQSQFDWWRQDSAKKVNYPFDTTIPTLTQIGFGIDTLLAKHAFYERVEGSVPGIISSATASPNPAGTGTVISFGISKEAYVKLELYDVLGERVSGVGDGVSDFERLVEPGNKSVPISLEGLPSGTYFARIQTAYGEVQSVKIVKE